MPLSVEGSESVQEKGGENDSHLKHNAEDPDAEFGGLEARRIMEKKLLWKVDLRMSIMVVIYILNYVCFRSLIPLSKLHACYRRLIAIMQG
jgi:hypothetical protein